MKDEPDRMQKTPDRRADTGPTVKRRLVLRAVAAVALGVSVWVVSDRLLEEAREKEP